MPPKILISAGVHPEEEAGVIYLKKIYKCSEWSNDMDIYIISCRNTYGFNITNNINNAKLQFSCETGEFYKIGERVLFIPCLDFIRCVGKKLQIKSLITPFSEALKYEGFIDIVSLRNNSQIHANSYYLYEGNLLDLNSRFSHIDSVFEFSTNNILNKYKPHYYLDLHESIGSECFLYVSKNNEHAITIAHDIVKNMISHNIPFRDCAKDRIKLERGIFALESFTDYPLSKDVFPVEIIFETGIDVCVEKRIHWIEIFIQSALELIYKRYDTASNFAFDKLV